jgi:hypothetical protein
MKKRIPRDKTSPHYNFFFPILFQNHGKWYLPDQANTKINGIIIIIIIIIKLSQFTGEKGYIK